MTVGLSEVGMTATKNCGACGHKLSLHLEQVKGWKQQDADAEAEVKANAYAEALAAAGGDRDKIDKIKNAVGSARYNGTPDTVWAALADTYPSEHVKKRDDAKQRLRVNLGKVPGTPACVSDMSVESSGDGVAVLRYEIRPSFWGGAMAEDDPAAVLRVNERLEQEGQAAIDRVAAVVGPTLDAPPAPAQEEPAAEADAALVATLDPAPATSGSLADELMKLARLRDSGVLTDEEFEAQKAKLLG